MPTNRPAGRFSHRRASLRIQGGFLPLCTSPSAVIYSFTRSFASLGASTFATQLTLPSHPRTKMAMVSTLFPHLKEAAFRRKICHRRVCLWSSLYTSFVWSSVHDTSHSERGRGDHSIGPERRWLNDCSVPERHKAACVLRRTSCTGDDS